MQARAVVMSATWILASVLLVKVLNKRPRVAIVLPVHTPEDVHRQTAKLWQQCHVPRPVSVHIVRSSNAQVQSKELEERLRGTGCFARVTSVKVDIQPQHDHHPLGASLLFFGALASPSIVMHNEWMLWMEPDVHVCGNSGRWLDKLLHLAHHHQHHWIVGGVMHAHSDPMAPFFSFAEHINGNALYNLRDDGFLDFLEEVQEEFSLHGSARFRDSFDIAIYQVARYVQGFWRWTKVIHKFAHSDFIVNHYNTDVALQSVCKDRVLLVHGKKVKGAPLLR